MPKSGHYSSKLEACALYGVTNLANEHGNSQLVDDGLRLPSASSHCELVLKKARADKKQTYHVSFNFPKSAKEEKHVITELLN
jgi:hypothetical protein